MNPALAGKNIEEEANACTHALARRPVFPSYNREFVI